MSTLDFFVLGSMVSLRSLARLGSSLSIYGASRMGSACSCLDFMNIGSSLSIRVVLSSLVRRFTVEPFGIRKKHIYRLQMTV